VRKILEGREDIFRSDRYVDFGDGFTGVDLC
jgi:hypothetical protein